MVIASDVGARREANARVRGLKDSVYKDDLASWGTHIEAAGAEMAVAKALGLYWDGSVNVGKREDLPRTGLEVRWNQNPERTSCKVKPTDTGIVIAVRGSSPAYELLGWIKAEEARRQEWLARGTPPAYLAPHSALSQDFGLLARQLRNLASQAELGLGQLQSSHQRPARQPEQKADAPQGKDFRSFQGWPSQVSSVRS